MTPAATQQQSRFLVRFMIRRDLPYVLDTEHRSFDLPWTEREFACLHPHEHVCRVADTLDGRVLGHVLYTSNKGRMHIVRLAVHPQHRRQGVGRALVTKLQQVLRQNVNAASGFITADVSEYGLAAQLFFRSLGFRWVETIPGDAEDVYHMRYDLEGAQC